MATECLAGERAWLLELISMGGIAAFSAAVFIFVIL